MFLMHISTITHIYILTVLWKIRNFWMSGLDNVINLKLYHSGFNGINIIFRQFNLESGDSVSSQLYIYIYIVTYGRTKHLDKNTTYNINIEGMFKNLGMAPMNKFNWWNCFCCWQWQQNKTPSQKVFLKRVFEQYILQSYWIQSPKRHFSLSEHFN